VVLIFDFCSISCNPNDSKYVELLFHYIPFLSFFSFSRFLLILKKEQSNEICRSNYPEPRSHLALFSVNWIFFVKRKSKILLYEHSVNKTFVGKLSSNKLLWKQMLSRHFEFYFQPKGSSNFLFNCIQYTHSLTLTHTITYARSLAHALSLSLSLSLSPSYTHHHTQKKSWLQYLIGSHC
jgi:hypothetical protein